MHGAAAVADRHQHCLTAPAAIQDMLRAVAATLVDAKLKTPLTSTGQTLVSLETSMRVLLQGPPAAHQDSLTPQSDGKSAGGVWEGAPSYVVVDSRLLPSWPPLPTASTTTALASLLVAMEQRLLLAHTGE
jgi:hypothetical protein